MTTTWWVFFALGLVASASSGLIVVIFLWRIWNRRCNQSRLQGAKAEFHLRREWLEAQFLSVASKRGLPRGLAWKDCDFQDEVSFARERHTGQLCALVGVAIAFEAIEGGGMEDNPNVGNRKAGSAVFRFDGQHWKTDGRALLNLEPDEAIERLRNELETVD